MRASIIASVYVLSLSGSALACSTVNGIKHTAYGWPDASGTPAYKCNGNTRINTVAGDKTLLGDGSAGKPYAAAAKISNSIFKPCELVYSPLLEKYFRIQDDCSGCNPTHIDLYIAQYNSNVGQTSCELAFGDFNYNGKTGHEVVRSPANSYLVNKNPLFVPGKCYNNPSDGRVFPNRDGSWKCPKAANAEGDISTTDDTPAADRQVQSSPLDSDPKARHSSDAKPTPVPFTA